MKVLITGGSGFLGKHLQKYFETRMTVKLLGRNDDSHFRCDLAKNIPVIDEYFDLVIHNAGKAHSVPRSEDDAAIFYEVNHQGTQRLLDALGSQPPKSFVFISSVSVYGLDEGENISEDCSLNATDPYGKSKALAEKAVQEWCNKNNVTCVIFRLPLLIGADAPGNLAAMVKAIKAGYYFNVAKGSAKKSMLLVKDVPIAIESTIGQTGIFNLTDGCHPSFYELSQNIALQLGRKHILNMPYILAKSLAIVGDFFGGKFPINSHKLSKIICNLTFDDSKARTLFGWKPTPVLKEFKING